MTDKRSSRRQFVTSAAALGAASTLGAATPEAQTAPLIHHVLFWLKHPDSAADRDALIAGLRTLAGIETVRGIHIGVPADTEARGVVDHSWSVSETLWFDDLEGQAVYQVHTIHEAFVANCSHLWEKVVVYDALAV
jgi:hypothetical protein